MAQTSPVSTQQNRMFDVDSVTDEPVTIVEPFQPFNPEAGAIVFQPEDAGKGKWVGAPSAFWDGSDYYLAYRTRRPKPGRGGLFQIAQSSDGEDFTVITSIRKEDIGTSSIERGALLRTDSAWRLYLSFVDPEDGRWRIDLIEAEDLANLDATHRASILTAADINGEGIKDPWVCQVGSTWYMIVSYAPTPEEYVDASVMHGTHDIYNTGTSKSLSGLATSDDGLSWTWHGTILEPSQDGWDAYAARINTVYRANDTFVGLYDGSRSVEENYEERCGLTVSNDLKTWTRLSIDGPAAGPDGGRGSVRYAEAVQGPGWLRFYYEYTRPDGSHELRTVIVDQV